MHFPGQGGAAVQAVWYLLLQGWEMGTSVGCSSFREAVGVQLFPQHLRNRSRTFSVWSILLVLLQRGTGSTGGASGVCVGASPAAGMGWDGMGRKDCQSPAVRARGNHLAQDNAAGDLSTPWSCGDLSAPQ